MIRYDAAAKIFTLSTPHTSYQMKTDADGRLLHTWYGRRLPDSCPDMAEPRAPHTDPGCWPDLLPLEYPAPGTADNRCCAVCPEYADGTEAADLRYASHKILPGKYSLPALPAFRQDANAESLCITLRDAAGLQVELWYAVYPDCDLITRAAVLTNTSSAPLILRSAASACLDFSPRPLELITTDGVWAGERTPHRAPLRPGEQTISSVRGIPGHAHNPAAILCTPDANETQGEAWGALLVYSGNFALTAESCEAGTRLLLGIHPYHFAWTLAPGQSFAAPEAAFVYSRQGLGEMSRQFHTAIRRHLLRRPWADPQTPRPVLINSWEACYFTFDEQRLLQLARAAKQADIDLFVLDDGWFQRRNDDSTSLGDWVADPAKLPGGLPGLCKKINDIGLDFGLWVEPEAISPDSDLYRTHPDWALQIPHRETVSIRRQYTLDFSRPEVVDGIWAQLQAVLDSCPIRYLKWDMNRSLANVYSAALPTARQGEVYHRYVLGVYELQRRLTEAYPDLLLENCAGGGARFDCGMLYFSPQIWCSDNTDARARMSIQYGTGLFYPGCTMGAHFSTVPNHCTGHISAPQARMAMALFGTFGFELDLTAYSRKELDDLTPFIAWYRAHGALLRGGDLYRLVNPDAANLGAAWMTVSPDKVEAAVFAVGTALAGSGGHCPRLVLQGLDESAVYTVTDGETTETCSGFVLQTLGLPLPGDYGEVPSKIWYLKQV